LSARRRPKNLSIHYHLRYIDLPLTNTYKAQIDEWLAEYAEDD
jgi:hypothetical protein